MTSKYIVILLHREKNHRVNNKNDPCTRIISTKYYKRKIQINFQQKKVILKNLGNNIIGYPVKIYKSGISEFVLYVEVLVICGHICAPNQTSPSVSGISKIGLHHYTQKVFPRVVMEPDFWFSRNWRTSLVCSDKVVKVRETHSRALEVRLCTARDYPS